MSIVQVSTALRCDAYEAAPGCLIMSRPVYVSTGPSLVTDGWHQAEGYPVRHICPCCWERGER